LGVCPPEVYLKKFTGNEYNIVSREEDKIEMECEEYKTTITKINEKEFEFQMQLNLNPGFISGTINLNDIGSFQSVRISSW
jgi:hypothetical protein